MKQTRQLHFKGEFRSYQKRVLENAERYLEDGKINIVAAPGSGKTILGLELICRQNENTLILSPTRAIRDQWGKRFQNSFLTQEDSFAEWFSTDLHKIVFLNSITYQALYSAMEKIATHDEDEDEDYSNIELVDLIKEKNIKTICLDEAHHLKNIWQKSLEQFMDLLDEDVKIISLTATPPYDSSESEWNKYRKVCGEVDEEIFVPELVAETSLCPHQDFIYFNYPTLKEREHFSKYRKRVYEALDEIRKLDFLKTYCEFLNSNKDYDRLLTNYKSYTALLVLFDYCGYTINEKIIKILTTKKGLPEFNFQYAEQALNFLLNTDEITDLQKELITNILKKYSLIHRAKPHLHLEDSLKHELISSVGKLKSIEEITKHEFSSLGSNLRLLILTDFIRKEELGRVSTGESFQSISIVSIFNALLQTACDLKIGVLSGSLIILPDDVTLPKNRFEKKQIPGTNYSEIKFKTKINEAIAIVSDLFEKGEIQALIGTKSLLGEGWDAPCVNTLILASFIGSYVSSNQMRGRAIRVYPKNPDKTANIWHLVTIEPAYVFEDGKLMQSIQKIKQDATFYDYEILKNRFQAFIGPNYSTGKLEGGIRRITAIKEPFTEQSVNETNQKMLELSKDRFYFRDSWNQAIKDGKIVVNHADVIDKDKKLPVFCFENAIYFLLLLFFQFSLLIAFRRLQIHFGFLASIEVVFVSLFTYFFSNLVKLIIPHKALKNMGIALYDALKKCGLINSMAMIDLIESEEEDAFLLVLKGASIHDQNIFNVAVKELLSPIDSPRYLLVKKGLFGCNNYLYSFACPSIIGQKKEYVKIFCDELKKKIGAFDWIYTRNEDGMETILKCRKRSYIKMNSKLVQSVFTVTD